MPAHISFSEGVVLPCAISTAATGLYLESYLGLEYPSLDPQLNKKTLFVWGGASSVGCCAIQLARDSGYEVFTTASPHNHSLCFALGADRYFDYHKSSILDDIVHALREKHVVGFFDAISNSHIIQACIDVIKRLQLKAKVIATNPVPQNVRSEGIVVKSGKLLKQHS